MKFLSIFLIIGLSSVSAATFSQTVTLKLHLENVSLIKVLEEIEKQTDYEFFYLRDLVDENRIVSVKANNESILVVLDELLKDSELDYQIVEEHIIIRKSKTNAYQQENRQSTFQVKGVVTDDKGEPLPGVNVIEKTESGKGLVNGVITGYDGTYTLDVNSEESIISFSFIGFDRQDIQVAGRSIINVVLVEEMRGLDEVVVIGYGAVKKSDLTGAVASVKADKLEKSANTSVAHQLSGRAAGLTVNQVSAQPGGGVKMQIRGAASGRSPLIIIDGFPVTGFSEPGSGNRYSGGSKETALNSINPDDIESIEVLKDASSTSIYGARAAGGVIIVTTKRGNEEGVKVNYRGSYSVQKLYGMSEMLAPKAYMTETNKVTQELWMYQNGVSPYGGLTWEEAVNEAEANNRPLWNPRYSEDDIANFTGGTKWLDEVTQMGEITQHDFSVSGGSTKTKYYLSLGYFQNEGVVKNNKFERYTGRLNLDQEFNKWLNGGLTTSISQIKNDNVPLGGGAAEYAGVLRSAMQFNPLIDVQDENGNYLLDPLQAYLPNPVSLLEVKDESRTERFLANAFLEASPFEGFKIKLMYGFDRNQGYRNTFLPTSTLYGKQEGGRASKNYNEKTDYLSSISATYNKKIGAHSLNLFAGYEYQFFTWEGFNADNSIFPYDGVLWNNLAMGEREKPGVGSYGGSSKLASYIGRVNYSYANKYLLTANLRMDGSSNFSENNQWGIFPGVSVAWRVTEEPFMDSLESFLSNLKLRAGYGQTGNDDIGYGITSYYTTGWNYSFNNKEVNGIGLASLGNPNLKWETQTDLNIGLDLGFFNNRINASVEYYNRVITDLLGNKSLMSYHEVTNVKYNLDAEKQSRGWEVTLNTVNFDNAFKWNTDATLTYYRDRWLKRDESWKPDIHDEEQAEWGRMMYWLSDGIVQPGEEVVHMPGAIPGTVKIKDVDGYLLDENGQRILDENGKPQYLGMPDGKLDNADLVFIGNNTPISVGLYNTFSYRNFDLNVHLYGMFNRWQINNTKSFYVNEAFRMKDGSNMMVDILDRWSFDNQDSDTPSILQSASGYGSGDYYLEKAWFVRLKSITLGYTLPKSILKGRLNSVRFFADAQNLFVVTPYSGTDPETDSMAAYPNQHTFSLGVDVTF